MKLLGQYVVSLSCITILAIVCSATNVNAKRNTVVRTTSTISTTQPGVKKKTSNRTAAKKTAVPSLSASKSMAAGKAIYMQSCVACHLPDGGGVPNLNPPLIKTSYVLGAPQKMINVLLKGMSQQPVDGQDYSNPMPPFNYLNDQQIADVLTFVRNSFGNKASIVTPAQVKLARGKK